MKQYFAYIRVSTPKQGKGVSLEEQQAAIRAHAAKRGIAVVEWFEEKETAAKTGRAVFSKMLARLEKGDADGVIIHKIDRSARNLWDWANLSKLFDRGIDVQFAHDSVDLTSRGGRLSADIMAIVAADYIRNLREEVKKGFYGRLKQGIYPLPAPIGYLDRGAGEPKAVDPERAPLVQWAFERYASGTVGLKDLRKELRERGLRTRAGKVLSLTGVSIMLKNPFYTSLIRIRRTNEVFEGKHPALVPRATFDRVQAILRGKTVARVFKHDFLFRRLVNCGTCARHLVGETHKGHVYYRCQGARCRGTVLREEEIDGVIAAKLGLLIGDKREMGEIGEMVEAERAVADMEVAKLREALDMRIAKCEDRLLQLTDALLDRLIDKTIFENRKQSLLIEKQRMLEELASLSQGSLPRQRALKYLELGNIAYSGYRSANRDERRKILVQVTSNLSAKGKSPAITLKSPFQEIANWRESQNGAPCSGTPRTRASHLLDIIIAADPESKKDSVGNIEPVNVNTGSSTSEPSHRSP